MRFRNREDAGRQLADALRPLIHGPAIVYGLPRGGVPLAYAVARVLKLPLDLVIARKIGHPWQPEYAIGAVTETGVPVFNEDERQRVDAQWLKARIESERREAQRRREVYCGGVRRLPASGKTAILVDDGVATGLTLQAAVEEVRGDHPARVIVGVGVAPRETVERFRTFVDEVVAVQQPEIYAGAVGAYFENFHQLSDEDVLRLMAATAITGGTSR